MDTELFVFDLDKLINVSRAIVYMTLDDNEDISDNEFFRNIDTMSKEEKEEMDRIISYEESKMIISQFVKRKRNKRTKEVGFFMKESDYEIVLDQFRQRMVSNIVSTLVAKDVLESAFDPEKNDFVFWVKKQGETDE